MTDEQQPTPAGSDPSTPGGEQPSLNDTPAATEPPATTGVSRRKVLIWGGAGVVGVAAVSVGAVAFYSSQTKQKDTKQGNPGSQTPQGSGSRMQPSGMPSGARPSGAPSGGAFPTDGSFPSGGPSGFPSGMPTDQPT